MVRKNNSTTALAHITGSNVYPDVDGYVSFSGMKNGVLVTAEIRGLPDSHGHGIYAFHIHNGTACTGDAEDPFADADGHYNPDEAMHPYHAGDLPPLFSNNGYAYMSVFTDRFNIGEIIGHVIIIHKNTDDFTTQPSGNSGTKIACGKIFLQKNMNEKLF